MSNYFYHFLEPVSEELARTLKELEGAIYSSPRSMLTHSRTLIEAVLEKVMVHENMPNEAYYAIIERIRLLEANELLTDDVKNALHEVRRLGNIAAHDVRPFRYSESLMTWERIYDIMKWFVEVYVSHQIEVPEYVDPKMSVDTTYDLEEMNVRFKKIEDLLRHSIEREEPKLKKSVEPKEVAATTEEVAKKREKGLLYLPIDTEPGLTPVRTLTYKDEKLEIPHFLRDAFILPQRFEESELFLKRLAENEQARLMSELPASLDGLHERIKNFNDSHTNTFFSELKHFIGEETRRRKLIQERQGELFLFYKSDEIVVTEDFGKEEINTENFTGAPMMIEQMNNDGIFHVRDLPKELVIIGKYRNVGKETMKKFFQQLKELQQRRIEEFK